MLYNSNMLIVFWITNFWKKKKKKKKNLNPKNKVIKEETHETKTKTEMTGLT